MTTHKLQQSILRVFSAGSVDDGKSTLLGRLLYETGAVTEDQLAGLRGSGRGSEPDFSLLVDGLRAERQQGITIDVAYRYFEVNGRKIVLADCPGHEQYTRNMATGASNADAAIVLIDAKNGITAQTRRHALISTLLGTPVLLIAINKMDLVGYSQTRFQLLRDEFETIRLSLPQCSVRYLPISALRGDNVAQPSERTPWYSGPPLTELLSDPTLGQISASPLRFPVQYVIRHQGRRWYCGTLRGQPLSVGEQLVTLPSGQPTTVKAISYSRVSVARAKADAAIAVELSDERDIGRGDILVRPETAPPLARGANADIVWMQERTLRPHDEYLLRSGVGDARVRVASIDSVIDITSLQPKQADQLRLNQVGRINLHLMTPLALDRYSEARATGAFLLIDPVSNLTAAAGMVRATQANEVLRTASSNPGVVWLNRACDAPRLVARDLREKGHTVVHIDPTHIEQLNSPERLSVAIALLRNAGAIALVEIDRPEWRAQIESELQQQLRTRREAL